MTPIFHSVVEPATEPSNIAPPVVVQTAGDDFEGEDGFEGDAGGI